MALDHLFDFVGGSQGSAAVMEAVGNFSGCFPVLRVMEKLFHTVANRGWVCVFQIDPRAQLGCPQGDAALLRCLRIKQQRNTVVQAFRNAVHPAVREEYVRLLKNRDLIHRFANGNILRNLAKLGKITQIASGENYLVRTVTEGRDAASGKIQPVSINSL